MRSWLNLPRLGSGYDCRPSQSRRAVGCCFCTSALACGARVLLLLVLLSAILWAEEPPEPILLQEEPLVPSVSQHWAFRPLLRPELPEVKHRDWCRQPLDRFVLAEWEKRGIVPLPRAARATLLRRVSFDLIGLPPSADLVLEGDELSDREWQAEVDRLLASPHYGPRWAQFWLDLARFAETDGFEHDKARPDAWKYRDWVIQAADQDMPYDRFVAEQVAGDLLHPNDPDAALPTAFCLSGPDMPDLNDQQERRHVLLNEMTATVASVFLGLQLGCAQCHDHKFDPISQAEFYRLRAFFENTIEPKRDEPLFVLGDRDLPLVGHVYARGDFRRPVGRVVPDVPRVAQLSAGALPEETTNRNRRTLAQWLTSSRNALAARVIANRVWQFHFGQGLCASESDFGFAGDEPRLAPLLDWLACELIESGWSLKHLHRLIVTSSVYQQLSWPEGGQEELWHERVRLDPENRLWSRFPRRRLDGEAIRDAMLVCAGLLNEERGGRGVRPPLDPLLAETLLKGQWEVTPRLADHYRRSIYLFARRNLRWPLFEAFDRPPANESCPRRHESITALQALQLLNSPFTHEMARHAARQTLRTCKSHPQAVRFAVACVWGRAPTGAETERLIRFIEQQQEQLGLSPVEAYGQLYLALFNTNAFLYVD
ncbi:MAG: hypothetical protein KatS3mg110_1473 [Pirellulaceae bacterium]|nr:MAG: hypothetical protein KatS3mg110_1473 [Pirellulaceae bacterium]